MNKLNVIAGGLTLMFVVGGVAACSSQPANYEVIQRGYYTPAHVYVAYPESQWRVVTVSRSAYNHDHTLYSTPSFEKSYVKTHTTITRSTTTVQRSTTTTRRR